MRKLLLFMAVLPFLFGCTVKYSFTGASIAPEVKTFSVKYFQNIAAMVNPMLSSTFTDALTDKFIRQTKLVQVKEDGDFSFEGEITNYTSNPIAVTSNEYASMNRLSITVNVKFVNRANEKMNFTRSFTQYVDYDSSILLQNIEGTIMPEIVEKLVTDIFNASASNW